MCRQNTQFNMYTTTSKQQEGCTFEDSHPKCFITTNSFAKGGERGDVHVLGASYTKVNSNRPLSCDVTHDELRIWPPCWRENKKEQKKFLKKIRE